MCFIDPQRLVPQGISNAPENTEGEAGSVFQPRKVVFCCRGFGPGQLLQSFIVSEPSIISLPNPAPGFFTSPEIDS